MKSFKITLTQKSPVCFSNSRHAQNIFYTHDYIPGSVLWGFFINRYVKSNNGIHEDFFNDNIRFHNCYIKMKVGKHVRQLLPVPLSLFTCKTEPYSMKEGKKQGHDLVDLIFNNETECLRKGCDSQLRPVQSGYFYYLEKETNEIYHPRKVVEMHNRIEKRTQNTKEDSLYSYELLDEVGREFTGQISVSDNSSVKGFIQGFNGRNICLGKARTSGYGYFSFNVDENAGADLNDFFEKGFEDGINIYLYSDVIIMDGLNRYQTVISPEILGLENEMRLEKSFARCFEVQGFNAKHQKTRINDIAIRKGSCFSYRIKPGADTSLIKKRMEEIELNGLGIRKNEGFGKIRFNRTEIKGIKED